MKQRVLICSSLAVALLAASLARADRVDYYIKGEMETHRVPGVALMVIQDGKASKTAAYGLANLELSVPVKPETVFEIGSITKQFTAAGILLLAQDGKLSVNDKISAHLANIPSAWTNITIRHLLTHTSGIKNYTGLDGFELRQHLTQAQFISAMGREPMEFAPGDAWKYCNTGFSLLGYIIENVSGENYWDFMSERVFRPLGMNATTDRLPSVIIPTAPRATSRPTTPTSTAPTT
jgi:CubicO group peptidase (beta-lactamase class C family)